MRGRGGENLLEIWIEFRVNAMYIFTWMRQNKTRDVMLDAIANVDVVGEEWVSVCFVLAYFFSAAFFVGVDCFFFLPLLP